METKSVNLGTVNVGTPIYENTIDGVVASAYKAFFLLGIFPSDVILF